MPHQLNDVHSRLNATTVAQIARPESLEELCAIIRAARQQGMAVSVAGGRHAMGGQQFRTGSLHVDTTALDRVLGSDGERGLLHIEAGAQWPAIIEASHAVAPSGGIAWGIRQKQTGVDDVTLAGSISANAHGRGLLMKPIGDDIEDLTLVNADGEVVSCSRSCNPELFSLVIGGYGLFGVIYSATLRLGPRLRLQRLVDVIDLDDAMHAIYRRVQEGCLFGDFQYVIDSRDERFLRRGVFACYKEVGPDIPSSGERADLTSETWLKLLKLAHDDKQAAFRLYSQHYVGTHGNVYWSDTMQLSTYIPSYSDFLESTRNVEAGPGPKETLVIGEHYVPRDSTLAFMERARDVLRNHGVEVIYGTIRSILRDDVSFLPWAREDFACVIFNLRTRHDAAGVQQTAAAFRALTDIAIGLGGSFFLTYHRYATIGQIEACYPRFREFLQLKQKYDPAGVFSSEWYEHYRQCEARP